MNARRAFSLGPPRVIWTLARPVTLVHALTRLKRIVDGKPIAAHVYVTERCNLGCSYCTEHDDAVPDPDLPSVKRWIDKLRALGCTRIGIQGGEPLLRPDLPAIVAHVKSRRLACSLATNGFALTERVIRALEDAGLDDLHVSVDRVSADPITRKALDRLEPRLALLARSSLRRHITSVLYEGSLPDLPAIQRYADSIGASFKAHLVHGGQHGGAIERPGRQALEAFIDRQYAEKRAGRPVRTTSGVLAHQKRLLAGGAGEGWTCLAGYKYLFVSARGALWTCSMNREPGGSLLDATPDALKANDRQKICQRDCGVYCVVAESLLNSHPVRFAMAEAAAALRRRSAGS